MPAGKVLGNILKKLPLPKRTSFAKKMVRRYSELKDQYIAKQKEYNKEPKTLIERKKMAEELEHIQKQRDHARKVMNDLLDDLGIKKK